MGPGDHHTNGLSIAIQIRWKFRFTFTSILTKWSIKNLVYATTANLLWFDGQQWYYWKRWRFHRLSIYDIVTETNILAQTVHIALQRLAFLQLVCLVLRISWLQYFPRFWHQNIEAWAKWSISSVSNGLYLKKIFAFWFYRSLFLRVPFHDIFYELSSFAWTIPPSTANRCRKWDICSFRWCASRSAVQSRRTNNISHHMGGFMQGCVFSIT